MSVVRWTVNGVVLPRNPEVFKVSPNKRVSYVTTVDGDEIRVVHEGKISTNLEVAWSRLEAKWKYWLHDLYINDIQFNIITHTPAKYLDAVSGEEKDSTDRQYKVTIDFWEEDWVQSGTGQKYDLMLRLKVQP